MSNVEETSLPQNIPTDILSLSLPLSLSLSLAHSHTLSLSLNACIYVVCTVYNGVYNALSKSVWKNLRDWIEEDIFFQNLDWCLLNSMSLSYMFQIYFFVAICKKIPSAIHFLKTIQKKCKDFKTFYKHIFSLKILDNNGEIFANLSHLSKTGGVSNSATIHTYHAY